MEHFTTLAQLQQSLTEPGEKIPPRPLQPRAPDVRPTLVSTVTGVNDLLRGVARATVPSPAGKYWALSARDVWLPPKLDFFANLGCILITLLLVASVFR